MHHNLNIIMRELIACLIIASLTLANGAPPNQVNQIFDEHSYVYKFCYKDDSGAEKCEIKEEDKFKGNPYKTCDLNPKYGNSSLLSFGNNNLILSFTDGNDSKIVTVSLENCNAREVSLNVDVHKIREIVLQDDKYYVIFNDVVCREFYCKAIYDSEGKIFKSIVPLFGVYAASDIHFKIASKGLLLNEYRLDGQVKLYFIPYDGFLNPDNKVLFSVPHGNWYGYSALENKLGFCAFDDGKTVANSSKKIICQQYDAEGKTKIMESEIPINKENHVEFLKATNFDNGLFVMVNEWQRKDDLPVKHTFLVYIDERGKQGKPIEIDLKCEKPELDQNFYKMPGEAYWIFYICFDPFNSSKLFRFSKCLAEDCYVAAGDIPSGEMKPQLLGTEYNS